MVSKLIASQSFDIDPKLYVLLASGIILLVMSALIVTLSVELSPNIKLPSNVILPLAFKLPVTFVSASNSIVPVPLGKKFISAHQWHSRHAKDGHLLVVQ